MLEAKSAIWMLETKEPGSTLDLVFLIFQVLKFLNTFTPNNVKWYLLSCKKIWPKSFKTDGEGFFEDNGF